MPAIVDLPWRVAREALERAVDEDAPIYLVFNPIEYHGPHLPLTNDAQIGRGVLADVHATLRPAGGAPAVFAEVDVGAHPTSGPGSVRMGRPTLRRVVRACCEALADRLPPGARPLVVLHTFHGAPMHNLALEEGARWLRARGLRAVAPFHRVLRVMVDLTPARAAQRFPSLPADVAAWLRYDYHAGFFETSLALHYGVPTDAPFPGPNHAPTGWPRRVADRTADASARLVREVGFAVAAQSVAWARVATPSGRRHLAHTGDPSRASAAAGQAFAHAVVAEMAQEVHEVGEQGAPPTRPTLGWLRWLTFGGRWNPTHVPVRDVAT